MRELPKQTDRSAKTEARYEKNYRMLVNQVRSGCEPESLPGNELIAYLIQSREKYSMSTWRQYKASVVWYIKNRLGGYDEELEHLQTISSKGLAKKSRQTSGKKKKRVPESAWRLLQLKLIERQQSGYASALALWTVLAATLQTGLRPVEWSNAAITTHQDSQRPVLRVKNAKHSNGRANGEYREIFLDGLDPKQIVIIKAAIGVFQGEGKDSAEVIQKRLADEMTNVISAMTRDSRQNGAEVSGIAMYSFRHQFLANAKQTFENPQIIAALAGHNSTDTAFQHYGKRRFGDQMVKVTPTPETIAAVQNVRSQLHVSKKAPAISADEDPPMPSPF